MGGAGGIRTQEINTRLLSAIPAATDRSPPTPAQREGEQVPGGAGESAPCPTRLGFWEEAPASGNGHSTALPGPCPQENAHAVDTDTGLASAWHMDVAGRGAGVAAATVFLKVSSGECSQPWLWAGGKRGPSSLEPPAQWPHLRGAASTRRRKLCPDPWPGSPLAQVRARGDGDHPAPARVWSRDARGWPHFSHRGWDARVGAPPHSRFPLASCSPGNAEVLEEETWALRGKPRAQR